MNRVPPLSILAAAVAAAVLAPGCLTLTPEAQAGDQVTVRVESVQGPNGPIHLEGEALLAFPLGEGALGFGPQVDGALEGQRSRTTVQVEVPVRVFTRAQSLEVETVLGGQLSIEEAEVAVSMELGRQVEVVRVEPNAADNTTLVVYERPVQPGRVPVGGDLELVTEVTQTHVIRGLETTGSPLVEAGPGEFLSMPGGTIRLLGQDGQYVYFTSSGSFPDAPVLLDPRAGLGVAPPDLNVTLELRILRVQPPPPEYPGEDGSFA